MDLHREVLAAAQRIAPYVRRTPVEASPLLSGPGPGRAFLKLENLQRTGSFKFRGAMNRLLTLDATLRARGVVAASTGNHGAALALGAALLDCRVTIFVPSTASPAKVAAIRARGAEIRVCGTDCVEAEAEARDYAARTSRCYVSPYNDPDVLAGQGTIGVELADQLPNLGAVIIAVGGGGLIAGVGGFLKSRNPSLRVVAVSPSNSAAMHAALRAGRVVDVPHQPTLSDGTAGGLESEAITVPLCAGVIDEFILVSEAEIADALRQIHRHHRTVIEGAAAAAVAGFGRCRPRLDGMDVAVLACGGNVDRAILGGLLAGMSTPATPPGMPIQGQ